MDLKECLGKKVEITICHHGRYHKHYGVLTDITKYDICLLRDNGRDLWIRKPTYPRDSFKVLDDGR